MKLKQFEAEAEVLGRITTVQFREGGLMLTGITYEDALEILHRIGPKLVGSALPRITGPAPSTPRKQPEKGAPSVRAEPAPKPAPKEEEPPFVPDAAPSKPELKLAKELEGVKEPGSDGAEIPEKVAKSTRFIDVLEWVISSRKLKKTQVDEIVAGFADLKEVPAVRRVRDVNGSGLKDKVISALAAYEEVGAGDAA